MPGGGVSKAVYFPIAPTQIGDLRLRVEARSAQAGDAVEQPLKVEVGLQVNQIRLIFKMFQFRVESEKQVQHSSKTTSVSDSKKKVG